MKSAAKFWRALNGKVPCSVDDVFVGKMVTIERCLARAREEYAGNAENLANVTRHDAVG